MNNQIGPTPTPVPPPAPAKPNPWLIATAVVVMLCCLCFGALGLLLAFWDPILQELGVTLLHPPLPMLL